MSSVSAWEWRYLRGALAVLAAVVALQIAGWLVYRVVHEETPPLQETVRCLTREKVLELTTATDPIASARGGGSRPASRVTASTSQSHARRAKPNGWSSSTNPSPATSPASFERKGKVVYIWEGVSTPTQRQTMYDCHYD